MIVHWKSAEMVLSICCLVALCCLLVFTCACICIIIVPNRKSPIVSTRRPLFTAIYLSGCTLTAFTRGIIAILTISDVGNQFMLWLASRCTLLYGHFTLVALRMWILCYDLHQLRQHEHRRLKDLLHLDESANNGPFVPWKCHPHSFPVPAHYGNARAMWRILSLCAGLLLMTVAMQTQHVDSDVEYIRSSSTFPEFSAFPSFHLFFLFCQCPIPQRSGP